MISFIVPAHNEAGGLARTLQAIHDSARTIAQPYEIIVVNDASTDATPAIARQYNATVVDVNHRQIAATRNSGGRAARGDRLFFVDADTTINPRALAEALRYLDRGAVGGGGPTLFDGVVPLYVRLMGWLGVIGAKLIGFTGGAFMFCTRSAFHASGGFDERLFWAEEGSFAMALKREGRFVVLWRPVITSGRRFRTLSFLQLPTFLARTFFSPVKTFTDRSAVAKIWYDSNRANDDLPPNTWSARLSNGIILVLLFLLLTGPVWNFIPNSLTPLSSPQGKFRIADAFFLCHVGLVFWPLAIVLFASLLRRKHWLEWFKLAALCAFCVWQGWEATQGVIWLWTRIFHWLAHF